MTDRTTEEAKREALYAVLRAFGYTTHQQSYELADAVLQWQAEQQKGEAPSMPSTWSVEVIADGESLVSIGENWLSGERALEEQDEKTILGAAMHLLSFIGHGLPPCQFDPDEPAASPHGVPPQPSSIQQRAIYLHEKAAMPWPDAEELALNEAGIDARAIDELIGESGYMGLESLLTTADELRRFTRSVLVHQPTASLPQAPKRPEWASDYAQHIRSISEPFTLDELREKIDSNEYSAELLLQHAMRLLDVSQAPQGEQTHTLVPDSALRWLFGEEGEFECPPEKFFRGKPPGYWWRSVFREKAGLSSPPPSGTRRQPAMKPITRDDTVHGVEYVTLAEANAAREADREAMRMALEALKTELSHGPLIKECHDAISALEQRVGE